MNQTRQHRHRQEQEQNAEGSISQTLQQQQQQKKKKNGLFSIFSFLHIYIYMYSSPGENCSPFERFTALYSYEIPKKTQLKNQNQNYWKPNESMNWKRNPN